jgi:hypothetical protein
MSTNLAKPPSFTGPAAVGTSIRQAIHQSSYLRRAPPMIPAMPKIVAISPTSAERRQVSAAGQALDTLFVSVRAGMLPDVYHSRWTPRFKRFSKGRGEVAVSRTRGSGLVRGDPAIMTVRRPRLSICPSRCDHDLKGRGAAETATLNSCRLVAATCRDRQDRQASPEIAEGRDLAPEHPAGQLSSGPDVSSQPTRAARRGPRRPRRGSRRGAPACR